MQVLLSRYSRSEDVVTGFASGEPAGADVARLTGMQSNPVALRTSFAGRAPASAAVHCLAGSVHHHIEGL